MKKLFNTGILPSLEQGVKLFAALKKHAIKIQLASLEDELVYQIKLELQGKDIYSAIFNALGDLFPEELRAATMHIPKSKWRVYDGELLTSEGTAKYKRVRNEFANFSDVAITYIVSGGVEESCES